MLKLEKNYLNENSMPVIEPEYIEFKTEEELVEFMGNLKVEEESNLVNWSFDPKNLSDMYVDHIFCGDDGIVSISYELA